MKKRVILLPLIGFLLASCGGNPSTTEPSGDNTQETGSGTQTDPNLKTFTGVTLDNVSVDYDGEAHTIAVEGAPDFATVTYTNNGPFVNAGTYTISAKISAEGYNDLNLSATLTINKLNFTGITFEGNTVDYDGHEHSIEISGKPDFASVTYDKAHEYTNAGTYVITATVTAPNYNDLSLTATLKINPIDLTGITFEGSSVEYDGNPHTIEISGNLPQTATVTYSSNIEGVTNTATTPGTYVITATIEDVNHKTLTLDATLSITLNDKEREMVVAGNVLFFQNAIDDDKLYTYEPNKGLLKASNEVISNPVAVSSGKITYVAKSVLSTSIKTATYANDGKVTRTTNYSVSADEILCIGTDDYIYNVNGLTAEKSGIYRATKNGSEFVIKCLSVGKSKFLTYLNSEIYFADKENDNVLTKINRNEENQTRTALNGDKIKNLYAYNGNLYYTKDQTLGDYIVKYNGSSTIKLTSDAGKDFVFIENDLYYVNTDKLNTAIVGNGIYKVSTTNAGDNNKAGTEVVVGKNLMVLGLTGNSSNLYYYECGESYKLIKCGLDGSNKVDLLDGFTKPIDEVSSVLNLGGQVEEHEGIIYYLDLYDDKTLHSYNPQTKRNTRMTSNKVTYFAFNGDYIYVNMVTWFVNNSLYRINLKTGSEPELVNEYDVKEMVFSGSSMYYVEGSHLHKADLDGGNDFILYDRGVKNLRMKFNNLYFINVRTGFNDQIECIEDADGVTSKVSGLTSLAVAEDGYFELFGNYQLVVHKNELIIYNNNFGTTVSSVLTVDDMNNFYFDGETLTVYYYNNTNKSDEGLYKIDLSNLTISQEPSLILQTTVTGRDAKYYCSNLKVSGDYLYFVNSQGDGLFGDAHTYRVNIDGQGEPEMIA